MLTRSNQTVPVIIIFSISMVVLGLCVYKLPLQVPIIVLLTSIVFLIALIKTDVALIILIFSMLLSPELKMGSIQGRDVVLRVDDILLFTIFFGWFAKMAINKELGLLRRTPLNPLIIAFIVVYIISTSRGILTGRISSLKSFFYILKFIEYFMIYFLVTNNIQNKKQIKTFVAAFLITCAIICAYTTLQIGVLRRTTAPFEGEVGGPNALGGYFILLFALCVGLFLYSPLPAWQFCSGALACFIIPPFLFTLSRGSYLAFIFMYLVFIILTRKKRSLLIGVLVLAIFILPVILPNKVTGRITKTFIAGKVYKPFGTHITLDASAAARVESWRNVFEKWKRRPFLGYGVTGVGLVDTQYPRVFGETGIVGFLIFIWLMVAIFRCGFYAFNNIEDDWERGLALGFLAGFIGLLIHSFSANTFIIIRIMEPFWFLAAVVMMLPEISALPAVSSGQERIGGV